MKNLEKIIAEKLEEDGLDISKASILTEIVNVVRGYARIIVSGAGVEPWLAIPYRDRPSWAETWARTENGSILMFVNLVKLTPFT